jgi:hypothetical protein
MLDQECVREEFYDNVVADGTPEQKQANKQKRFRRTVDRAVAENLIGRRDIKGVTYLWFINP